jgi:peptide/nickel transport system substrate-binding protein
MSSVLRLLTALIIIALALAACRQTDGAGTPVPGDAGATPAASGAEEPAPDAAPPTPSPTAPPTPLPTATAVPPKELVVCLDGEPADVYLYGDTSPSAVAVGHALYEPPYTSLGFAYQPLALTKLPNIADGDAQISEVETAAGSLVVDADGEVVTLARGVSVRLASGEIARYDRTPLMLPQVTAEFTFRPLVWSDGTPVTAEDSVFSFEIAGDRRTPQVDYRIAQTSSYEAVDDLTVRWTGLPGLLAPDYVTYVWSPLPRHQLEGIERGELASSEEAAVMPLSYGAFQIDAWTPGESIRLSRNPHYDRAAEGLPALDTVEYRFLEAAGDGQLPEGYEGCDILTQELTGVEALPALEAAATELTPYVTTTSVIEYLIFGVDPSSALEATRPDWFEDARVRQGIAQCVDRQALVDELEAGQAPVESAYAPIGHPLLPADIPVWPFDPEAGAALLDEAGYTDANGDGVREDLASSQPFTVTLSTNAESDLRLRLNEMVADNLRACGIEATVQAVPAAQWFAPGPQGPVFGRRFDIAEFAWVSDMRPQCELFTTSTIPGQVELGFAGWDGLNVSGWSNELFDAACAGAGLLLPGQPGHDEAHQEALRIFAAELPALPLFSRLRAAAAAPGVVNFRPDPTQPSELWNIFELDIEQP